MIRRGVGGGGKMFHVGVSFLYSVLEKDTVDNRILVMV